MPHNSIFEDQLIYQYSRQTPITNYHREFKNTVNALYIADGNFSAPNFQIRDKDNREIQQDADE